MASDVHEKAIELLRAFQSTLGASRPRVWDQGARKTWDAIEHTIAGLQESAGDVARGRYLIRHGVWLRFGADEQCAASTCLAIQLPHDVDFSTVSMRKQAVNQQIAQHMGPMTAPQQATGRST